MTEPFGRVFGNAVCAYLGGIESTALGGRRKIAGQPGGLEGAGQDVVDGHAFGHGGAGRRRGRQWAGVVSGASLGWVASEPGGRADADIRDDQQRATDNFGAGTRQQAAAGGHGPRRGAARQDGAGGHSSGA